jgi:hypothetical protein
MKRWAVLTLFLHVAAIFILADDTNADEFMAGFNLWMAGAHRDPGGGPEPHPLEKPT